jgi:hypothetical protein
MKIANLLKMLMLCALFVSTLACKHSEPASNAVNILFLHHSTGEVVWKGDKQSLDVKGIHIAGEQAVPEWFSNYNKLHKTNYVITEKNFPAQKPYGWKNYPYDYYNIWVKHAGNQSYMEEPTLEMLTPEYEVIVFKHCYPVSMLDSDTVNVSIDSDKKTIQNYKLQYLALRDKMKTFASTKFIVWTGAVMLPSQLSKENQENSKAFFDWVKNEWDQPGDNIFVWDFYALETNGGLFLDVAHAESGTNPHPNTGFAAKVAPLFCQRIADVIENNGEKTTLTGQQK